MLSETIASSDTIICIAVLIHQPVSRSASKHPGAGWAERETQGQGGQRERPRGKVGRERDPGARWAERETQGQGGQRERETQGQGGQRERPRGKVGRERDPGARWAERETQGTPSPRLMLCASFNLFALRSIIPFVA